MLHKHRAQSLLEALLSIALGVLLIGSSVGLIGLSLKSFNSVKQHLQANSLMRQTAEVIQSLANDNWHSIYNLTKSTSTSTTDYKITALGNTWSISSGQATSTINEIPYKRYFRVYNVLRSGGNISDSGDYDPSTQKITIFLGYGNNYVNSSSLSFYLTRSYNNQVAVQNDWSGGSEIEGPYPSFSNTFATSTNINFSTPNQITMAATTSDATLTSSVLDTGVSDGAGFNSAFATGTWDGIGSVKIQFAFSNCSNGASNYPTCNTGTWDYYAYLTTNTWSTSPNPDWSLVKELVENTSLTLATTGSASPQNKRYIRYKVYLSTTGTSPQMNDIIINWSP